jgi:hypothetical protein
MPIDDRFIRTLGHVHSATDFGPARYTIPSGVTVPRNHYLVGVGFEEARGIPGYYLECYSAAGSIIRPFGRFGQGSVIVPPFSFETLELVIWGLLVPQQLVAGDYIQIGQTGFTSYGKMLTLLEFSGVRDGEFLGLYDTYADALSSRAAYLSGRPRLIVGAVADSVHAYQTSPALGDVEVTITNPDWVRLDRDGNPFGESFNVADTPTAGASYVFSTAMDVAWRFVEDLDPLGPYQVDATAVLPAVPSAADPVYGRVLPQAVWASFTLSAGNTIEVDLLENSLGILFRACRVGTEIRVERSADAGATWTGTVVANDACEDADAPSCPTLTLGRYDDLNVYYHNSSRFVRCFQSRDHGASWLPLFTHTDFSRTYPAAVWQHGRLIQVWCRGSLIEYAKDSGDGFDPVVFTTAPLLNSAPQRVSLKLDRRGIVHTAYRGTGGNLEHAYLRGESDTFSGATHAVFPGEFPSLAAMDSGAVLSWFDDGVLKVSRWDEGIDDVAQALSAPAGDWTPGYCGLLVSRRGDLYFAGQRLEDDDGTVVMRWSPDGQEWAAPA